MLCSEHRCFLMMAKFLSARAVETDVTHLGPVFWLGDTVPAGFEHFNYPTANSTTLSAQTRADAAAYVAALVDAEPLSDAGKPNERVMYELPGDRRRLMMLLRAGGAMPFGAPPGMLASTCVLEGAAPDPPPQPETMHFCRPITGIFNVGLPGDRMPKNTGESSNATEAAIPWPGARFITVVAVTEICVCVFYERDCVRYRLCSRDCVCG
eukprot:m.1420637 g.1420637  ORF g.1420637 m.1420637 type:complete len:210 (+) comp25045_c1_seq46:290-919(+)